MYPTGYKNKLLDYYIHIICNGWAYSKQPRICKLIQPTEKGYNFLDIETNKCLLKHHLYPYRKWNTEQKELEKIYTFFVNDLLTIQQVYDKNEIQNLTDKFNQDNT